jgi:hypothetical protein
MRVATCLGPLAAVVILNPLPLSALASRLLTAWTWLGHLLITKGQPTWKGFNIYGQEIRVLHRQFA